MNITNIYGELSSEEFKDFLNKHKIVFNENDSTIDKLKKISKSHEDFILKRKRKDKINKILNKKSF